MGALFRELRARVWLSLPPAQKREPSKAREEIIMNDHERLSGKRIAILATEGFEQSELERPREALDEAGAETDIVSPEPGEIRAWNKDDFGDSFEVDVKLDDADAEDYDGLLLPGGVMNPDQLRMEPKAIAFVRAFFAAGKPVAAICHGPQVLIDAEVVRGRKLTSYPSIKRDLLNAGANWVDEEVVVDNGLVTSRKPDDIPAFNDKMVEEFAEGVHAGQRVSGLASSPGGARKP
jgi:deglycase